MTNDHREPIEGAEVSWRIARADTDEALREHLLVVRVPADTSQVVDRISWAIPAAARPGAYRVTMQALASDGQMLSTNHTDVTVR